MTLKEFCTEFEKAWTDPKLGFPDTADDYTYVTVIINQFQKQYYNSEYTKEVNKEVEVTWQRKNSKLGKALK